MQEYATGPETSGATRPPMPQANESPHDLLTFEPQHYVAAARHDGSAQRSAQLANALGWFSIGLGLAELLAPRAMSKAVGVGRRPGLLRALGARELASGIGILSRPRPTGWLWSRVAGDAMDLALLGLAARSGRRRSRLGIAAAAVAGVAALDVLASMRYSRQPEAVADASAGGEVAVEKYVTINRSADECYRYWRDFSNFPRFMKHIEAVEVHDDLHSHWTARGPAGAHVEWDAEVTADHPGEFIAWHSLPGADIENAGLVRFERAPGGRGTIVRVELQYRPPGGAAGALVARLFGEEPAQQVAQDLRRFKQLIETGEIPTTVGQTAGPRSAMTRLLFKQGAPG
jgi:uncharacterized membrane protein